jgi:hypothetical protein
MVKSKTSLRPKLFISILTVWTLGTALLIAFLMGAKYQGMYIQKAAMHAKRTQHIQMQKETIFSYSIIDGSLYKVFPNRKSELAVDKKQLKSEGMEKETPFEIISYDFSPDKSKVLLHAQGGISADLLFIVECTGGMVSFISYGEESAWSPNSRYIAYTRRPGDVGPLLLNAYDVTTHNNAQLDVGKYHINTSYSKLEWLPDSTAITADFEQMDTIPMGKIIKKGTTTIKLLSNSTTSEE